MAFGALADCGSTAICAATFEGRDGLEYLAKKLSFSVGVFMVVFEFNHFVYWVRARERLLANNRYNRYFFDCASNPRRLNDEITSSLSFLLISLDKNGVFCLPNFTYLFTFLGQTNRRN